MANSPLEPEVAPYADPAMPMPSSTTPRIGERSDGRLSARRPASTATTSCRDAIQAGTTVARKALASPKSAMPTRCSHGTSNGPNQVFGPVLEHGQQQPRRPRCRGRRRAPRPRPRARRRRRGSRAGSGPVCHRSRPAAPGCATAGGRSRRTPARRAARPRAAPSRRRAR